MSDDRITAELLDLSRRAGPRRPGAFDRATEIRGLLRQSDRPDSVDELLRSIDRALLRIDEPNLQEVGRAALRRPPYSDDLLEDRLDQCASVLAKRLEQSRHRDWRDNRAIPASSQKTMLRRRAQTMTALAPLLRTAIAEQTPGPKASTPRVRPIPGDRSEFGTDISIPDGSLVQPGEVFEKRWELRNAGTVPWRDRFLTRLGASEGNSLPQTPARVPIPDTEPGQSVVVAVTVQSPTLPGTYEVHWKMSDESGRLYFPDRYSKGIWFTVVVPGTN